MPLKGSITIFAAMSLLAAAVLAETAPLSQAKARGGGAERAATSEPSIPPSTSEPAPQRCAVLASPNLVSWGVADLIQTGLAEQSQTQVIERTRIDDVLRELTLAQVAGSESVAARLKLGHLLGADVLIFLRDHRASDSADWAIELLVARADEGVRVCRYEAIWEPAKIEEISRDLLTRIASARQLCRRPDLQLFAVPPFEDLNVGLQDAPWRRGFAQVAEMLLSKRGNIAVIELAEADAFRREMAIGGKDIRRSLPYYLLGSFRVTGNWDEARVALSFEIRQGDKTFVTTQIDSLLPESSVKAFENALEQALTKIDGQQQAKADIETEAKLLTRRGDIFGALSELDQAIPLYESALLCRPDYLPAHVGLVRSYSRMMRTGVLKSPMARKLYYSPNARMQMAERALEHFARAVRDPQGFGVTRDLDNFGRYFQLEDYDFAGDWDRAAPLYRSVSSKYDELVLSILSDPRTSTETGEWFESLSRNVCSRIAVYAALDSAEAQHRAIRWIEAVSKVDGRKDQLEAQAQGIAALFADKTFAPSLEPLADKLLATTSENARMWGQVVRELARINDRASCLKALDQIQMHVGAHYSRRQLQSKIESCAWARVPADQRVGDEVGVVTDLMIPKLTCVNLTAKTDNGELARMYGVNDWLVCRPGLELIAAEGGVWRVKGPGQVELLFRMPTARLRWDGQYIWAIGWRTISVLTPDGHEFVRYQGSELNQMSVDRAHQFVPIAPGKMCMIAAITPEPAGQRTWAGLLYWEKTRDGFMKKVEPFFEARSEVGESKDVERADRPFPPEWALMLPKPGPDGEPLIVVDRLTDRPLILDPLHKKVRVAPFKWPRFSKAILEGDWIYLSPSKWAPKKDCIYRVQSADQQPEEFLTLQPPPDTVRDLLPSYYALSMVYRQGQFHFLSMPNQETKQFVWLTVDAKTGLARVLADPLPDMYTPLPRLLRSDAYDMVIWSKMRIFGASIPTTEAWPRLEERATHRLATRPATTAPVVAQAPAGQETKLMRGHTYKVVCTRFSKDGHRAISSGWFVDQMILVWDVEQGKILHTLRGHSDGIYSVAFSPDGRHALSGGYNGSIRLWDIEEEREIRMLSYEKKNMAIGALAYSPDGKRAASGTSNGYATMWDMETCKPIYHKQPSNGRGVWGVAFSGDGRIFAAGANGAAHYVVSIMNVADGREIRRVTGPNRLITSVALSPDGRYLAASSWDTRISVWDVTTGRLLRRLVGNEGGVYGLAFLPDGKRLISGGGNRLDPAWMREDGSEIDEYAEKMSMGGDNSVRLWDIETGKELARFQGHARAVRSVDVSPDGRYGLSGSDDHTVRVWSLTGPLPAPPPEPQAQASSGSPPNDQRTMKIRLAAAGGLGLLLAGIWIQRRRRAA